MIEQALIEHLSAQPALTEHLATYAGEPAIFNQEAPADVDELWGDGPQYGRIVFAVDIQGDPARTMGGLLAVDILCNEDEQFPEDIEPILRPLIHGYFFSAGALTVSAQHKNSAYFTQQYNSHAQDRPTDKVTGCTLTFDLLAFPIMTTGTPDVIERVNEWTQGMFDGVHVINYGPLPSTAWKPSGSDAAIYWRVTRVGPCTWIPSTRATLWRTATLAGHVFAVDTATVQSVCDAIDIAMYAQHRITRAGESQILFNRDRGFTVNMASDPLRTGQIVMDATFGKIVLTPNDARLNHITVEDIPVV